ncbi:MAG: hypothetical protein IPM36_20710 [Lewinellaceae bacterium]|nr:hypothetical protein [Lewinellaceae bacterium]
MPIHVRNLCKSSTTQPSSTTIPAPAIRKTASGWNPSTSPGRRWKSPTERNTSTWCIPRLHRPGAGTLRPGRTGSTAIPGLPRSFGATAAVGATVLAMERGDFALVRPPGHHAYRAEAHGFCLFNNIAIAAQKAVDAGKRVLILDFDGHLGDGTMDIFYRSDQVLYWSLHQYPAYPGNGSPIEIGAGAGLGFTINCPLPAGSGDDIFRHAVEYMLPAAGEQFQPMWWPFPPDSTRTSSTPCRNCGPPAISTTGLEKRCNSISRKIIRCAGRRL